MKQLRSFALLSGALSLLVSSYSLQAGTVLTNIFSFNGTNGSSPTILVRAGNNKLYGITQNGGPNYVSGSTLDYGGVYSITSDGTFSNLYFFEDTNGIDGLCLTLGTDGNFYGTTADTVFRMNPDGTMADPHLAVFPNTTQFPFGLVQDLDGTLYGTMAFGGSSGYGTIYKIDTHGVFSTFATFDGTNGVQPHTLLLGADDNFYGLAQLGGNGFNGGFSGNGVIFRVDRSGNLTNIFNFGDSNGVPNYMVQGFDGDLYGVCYGSYGTTNTGTIFRVTTNGVLVWSFSFNGTNGSGGTWITPGNDGNFYGLTGWGGIGYNGASQSGLGTVFRITTNESFTSLFQFNGTNDASPSTIIQGTDGDLYGTCTSGGAFGNGAVFKLILPPCPATNRLMLTTVANISDIDDFGDSPVIMQGNDGMLYGVTMHGGAFGAGTVFRSTLSGSLTTLVSFDGTNGADPEAPPVQAADGNFYGTTYAGGSDWTPPTNEYDYGNYGTVYRMDSGGDLTTIFSFSGTNGIGPASIGGLIAGNDGALYGVTSYGGGPDTTNSYDGDGTIFKITTNGDFTPLASFNGTNGSDPVDIIQASDGNFYGVARGGGTNGFGTIFQMTPGGPINPLVQFDGTNGAWPLSIMQASDGCLYGVTEEGGAFYAGGGSGNPGGYGAIFKVTTNGNFTLLASFDATNGALPNSKLIEICPGLFYGIAFNGGLYPGGPGYAYNFGTFFRVTTNGDLTALLSFGANSLLPAVPQVSLIKASDGNFYGGAQDPSPGSIFCIRPVQAPVLQPLAQAGQLNLNWNAWAGYSYNVMYETNLTGTNWNLLSTVTPQTNGITSFSDSIGPDTQRFYRVVLQLP